MSELLTISAKRLGWLAQPDFCPRCFFVKWRLNWHGPWELPMPIYNTLDRAQKQYICRIIDETGRAPAWMADLGEIVGYVEPPSYRKFSFVDPAHRVRVWGQADLIPVLVDGRIKIVDLKTAKARGDADALAPMYKVQQCCYAMAAEYQGLGEVAGAALLYFTAQTGPEVDLVPGAGQPGEMVVPFEATVHPLEMDRDLIHELCGRFRELVELTGMPEPFEGCQHCAKTEKLHRIYAESESTLATAGYQSTAAGALRTIYAQHFGMRR